MKRTLIIIAGLLLAGLSYSQDFRDGFRNPPQEARVRVWWHWMDGNISKEGIRKDIEWMYRSGIGGFHQFDAGGDSMGGGVSIVEKKPYMGESWKEAFRYAIGLADSLGMEVAIASAPGWSSTGGPWVKPENAMKKLVWRTLEVTGNPKAKKPAVITLPEPFTTVGKFQNAGVVDGVEPWYRDVAVVAVRLPDEERSMAELGAVVTSSGGDFTLEMLTDGDLADGAGLPFPGDGEDAWIQFEFPRPQTVRALTLVGGDVRNQWEAEPPTYRNSLECSDDGKDWREVCRIPSGGLAQLTVTIPETTARLFRLKVAKPLPDMTYAAYGYVIPAPESAMIHELVLHNVVRVNHAEEKAGFAAPHDLADYPTPETATPVLETVDLTGMTAADGTLTWRVPAGRWRIYRFGASLTGKQNHPAPPEATGLEVDKLDEAAWMDYFRKYMDMYKEAAGGMVGQHGVQYILTDSYEAEQMTWTPTLPEVFRDRRGYDLIDWLPVLTGEIVWSSERSEAFLFDWRKTLGEMFAENYDRINLIVKEYGMKGRYTESHENGRVYVGDGMDLKMTADVPMSAIWMPDGGGGSTIPMAMSDIKESSSVAHVFGQNIAAAESFTASGMSGNAYAYYPGNMKYTADLAMSMGLNRFVIHESAHQPSDAHMPGLGLMIFGQWFNRHETWAEYARYWTDYLARSCYMLQQGRYVADILWYYGEDTNIAGIYGHELPDVPEGYSYDFINPNGLLNVLSVKDGALVTESGMKYRVLVLGEHCRTMSMEVLRKIDELVRAGAVVSGRAPERASGLCDDRAEFDRLVADIWQAGRPNVHTGQLKGVLAAHGVAPDFSYTAPVELRFVHRDAGSRQIYWISNLSDERVEARIGLRDGRGARTVYNPETGETLPGALDGDCLTLEQGQALFVVCDPEGRAEAARPAPKELGAAALRRAWTVSFDGPGAPAEPELFDNLQSLSRFEDPAMKYFSGTATYTNSFTVGKKETVDGLRIDLGKVYYMADVFVNGEHAGFLWKAPYRLEWYGPVNQGENTIEVRVINLWPNRLIGDAQRGATKTTFTSSPFFYRADSPLLPAGLVGPVTVTKLQE